MTACSRRLIAIGLIGGAGIFVTLRPEDNQPAPSALPSASVRIPAGAGTPKSAPETPKHHAGWPGYSRTNSPASASQATQAETSPAMRAADVAAETLVPLAAEPAAQRVMRQTIPTVQILSPTQADALTVAPLAPQQPAPEHTGFALSPEEIDHYPMPIYKVDANGKPLDGEMP